VLIALKISDNKKDIKKTETVYSFETRKFLFNAGCINAFENTKAAFPFQNQINMLLSRSCISGNKFLLFFDLFFPEFSGMAQGSGFYIAEDDNAQWVEDLLVKIEEERIAEELKQMELELKALEDEQTGEIKEEDINPDLVEEEEAKTEAETGTETEAGTEAAEKETIIETPRADEIEAFLNNVNEGKNFTSSDYDLSFFEFGNEVMVQQKNEDGYIIINSSGSDIRRNYYDNRMLLVKKEYWTIKSANDYKISRLEEFEYSSEDNKLISKKISLDEDIEIINYNSQGLIEKVENYLSLSERKVILKKRFCKYNDENKIISDEVIDYNYKDEKYKKLSFTFSKKYTYFYNEGEIPADFNYYENNIIKMRNKYSTQKGEYTSQVFFEDGLSVKSYYINNVRQKDVYFNGDTVIREKVYENEE